MVLEEYQVPLNVLLIGAVYCLYAISSSLNLPLYIIFRTDFRRRFFTLLTLNRRGSPPTSIVVVTPSRLQSFDFDIRKKRLSA